MVARISTCVAALAFSALARAEVIQFPKENPVFSVGIPADSKKEFTKTLLSIALNFETSMLVREVPLEIHDDEAARKYLYHQVDDYLKQGQFYAGLDRMAETPRVPDAKEALSAKSNIKGFHVDGIIENQRRTGHRYDVLAYSAWIFSCDDKKVFHGNDPR